MKRALSFLLALCLLAVPALADEALSMLPAVLDYSAAGYTDVPADSWYAQAVQVCYETGLMTGTEKGFEPELTLTGGQLAAIAARLREAIVGDAIPQPAPDPSRAWYAHYVSYLEAAGVAVPDPELPATRLQFAQLLSAVVPDSSLPAINAITALPDTQDPQVLRLYNAGVLTGNDSYGTFDPAGTLRRHECAAMVARVVQPQLRKALTLQEKPAASTSATSAYEEELLATEAVRVNGRSIPFSTLLDTLNALIFRADFSMAANGGDRLDWDASYSGIDDLEAYFLDQALSQTVQDYLVASRAAALGCDVDALPQVLTPDPASQLDHIYRAKHILVDDEATAVSILGQLMASPSMDTFDRLMDQYSTDPGSKSNPDGYLFTDGEMVTEFENAVKALDINACSTVPVKSSFGYHLILRLDPTTYPDWEKTFQQSRYEDYVTDWLQSSTVTPNSAELNKLDVRGRYEQYLANMGF